MNVATLAVALLVKPALVVGGATLLARLIRRRGAAARHALWTGAILALLTLPLLGAFLPPLRFKRIGDAVAPLLRAPATTPQNIGATQAPTSAASQPAATVQSARERMVDGGKLRFVAEALFAVWMIVALALATKRLVAERSARRLITRAVPPTPALAERCAAVARSRAMRPVRVVLSDETPSPAVAGAFTPVVILPRAAESWTDTQIDAVMIHELSHVERRDCLTNLLADLAAVGYWCNPVVRLAARRVRTEGELACDEEALRAGSEPDTYAAMILDFARTALATRAVPQALTAAARPSELESRVIAVLGLRRPGEPLRRWMAVGLVGMVPAVTFPVAVATLSAAPDQVRLAMMPPVAWADSVPAGLSERLPINIDRSALVAAARRALAGPDSALAAKLVAALNHAPKHENDLIRDRAHWAISLTRGDRLLEPVVEALEAHDWRVQSYAAWTIAVAQNRRAAQLAVPRLLPLLKHPVWRVRAMAAFALCELGAREAVDGMVAALSDDAWQVRVEAVEYLAGMGEAANHPDAIRARLTDEHIAVRRAAERALKTP